ncbi:MAG: 3-hydroxyacyl-CoA dehydrogenase NAD-binding domain-containing protein [Anderseniella sp.]|nr:3-hydroxyacyl-CoA dehydrogenase NAD-binding domain-containing protein [Anderseniella sp.]
MASPVSYALDGEVAVITIDNPPVNALSHAVREGLLKSVERFQGDSKAKAAVIVGAGRTFIAGADIKEFGKPLADPQLPHITNVIEASEKPVVAALHGTALGGGFEVALGCHYRVALKGAKVGLPEVNLGILPGAGGTQRTPRLAGVEMAAEMITSGRHVGAMEAQEAGLVDHVDAKAESPTEAGVGFARLLLGNDQGPRPTRDITDKIEEAKKDKELFDRLRDAAKKKARGQLSPVVSIDAILAAVYAKDFDEGMKIERQLFQDLMKTPQREALIHAFFGERAVGKVPELKDGTARKVEKIGVIGGGTMGSGITLAMMNAGIPVVMVERDDKSIEAGRGRVEKTLQGGIDRGKLTEEKRDWMLENLYSGTTDMQKLADCDLVIEAVFESMDVKKDVFTQLDAICKDGAVLATNTSYLDINEIAAMTKRPEDVIGMHFFSPANIMRLLEIVVADKTHPDVVATAFDIAKRARKVGVRAGVCDGFIGNRILGKYLRVAQMLVEDGATPYEVDQAVVGFGYPMGPFAMSDLAGLDIGWMTRKRKAATRNPEERYAADWLDRICEKDRFGQKTGRGVYIYKDGARRGEHDPEVLKIIEDVRKEKGIEPRSFSADEIMERYMAAMINEGAKVLEEGIALRPVDIDIVQLTGYGHPRWRGGPMKYADMLGLKKVLASIRKFEKEDARFWKPAQLLVDLVEKGETFDSLNKKDA